MLTPELATTVARAETIEQQIARLDAAEAGQQKPQRQVLFLGSSTFHNWDVTNEGETATELDKAFSEFQTVGTMARALHGSIISETTEHIPRLVWPYNPRAIVFYAGENDVKTEGATGEKVRDDFKDFVNKVREKEDLANIPITYVSIKPSPWLFAPDVSGNAIDANKKVHEWINKQNTPTHKRLYFLNVWKFMTDEQQETPSKFFKNEAGEVDEKHINAEGYRLWSRHLHHYLRVMLQAAPAP